MGIANFESELIAVNATEEYENWLSYVNQSNDEEEPPDDPESEDHFESEQLLTPELSCTEAELVWEPKGR